MESTWGCRFLWLAKGIQRAYAGLQRIHKKARLTITKKQINKFFILIKDYTDDMSEDYRQTVGKEQ